MQFVMLNGPPRSGKDTAALAIMNEFFWMSTVWEKFSFPNKLAFAGMMNANIDSLGNVEYYEEHKEEIIDALGISYRQWQIAFSETFMKPLYGEQVFAKLLLKRIFVRLNELNWLCVISDCGFQVEIDVLVNSLPNHDFLLITVRREGCSFAGDSREYVRPIQNMKHQTIYNNGSKLELEETAIGLVRSWLNATQRNAQSTNP